MVDEPIAHLCQADSGGLHDSVSLNYSKGAGNVQLRTLLSALRWGMDLQYSVAN